VGAVFPPLRKKIISRVLQVIPSFICKRIFLLAGRRLLFLISWSARKINVAKSVKISAS
jgi:hypothetical protein